MSGRPIVVTPRAKRVLEIAAGLDPSTRERLARVRRLTKSGGVRHRTTSAEPKDLRPMWAAVSAGANPWRAVFAADAEWAMERLKTATRDALLGPKNDGQYAAAWADPILVAADLEVQAVASAVILRDKKADLPDDWFDLLTKAWRRVGLTVPQ